MHPEIARRGRLLYIALAFLSGSTCRRAAQLSARFAHPSFAGRAGGGE